MPDDAQTTEQQQNEQQNENADRDAQNALADAQEAETEDDENTVDPKVKAKLERVNREARALRQRVKDLEPKASKWDEYETKNKSELDRIKDDLAAKEVELSEFRVSEVRRKAALNAGLDVEMAEFITAADDNEALEQAQKLAKRMTPATSNSQRKGADLRQGPRGDNASAEVSRDDILRAWAGYQN